MTGGWSTIPYRNVTYLLEKKLETILYVKADFKTETLSPGDTVNVIVKKVDEEGNENNFSPSTNFEVGLEEGCGAGYILDAAGQPQDYISSIQRPIRFVVNDNLTEADTLIKLRVGVPDGVDTVYKPYDEFPLLPKISPGASAKRKSNKEPLNTLESEYCTAIFNHSGYGVAKGKIEDDCEEPIVECTDIEPQKISDEGDEFQILRKWSHWEWQDQAGITKSIFLDDYYCFFHHPGSGGLTKVLVKNIKTRGGNYLTASDLIINACLIKDEVGNRSRWSFNIDNIRIPIYSDVCGIPAERDLKDSLSTDIWKTKVLSYEDYLNVIAGIDYEIVGSYSQFDDYPSNYVFSSGIMAHEGEHVARKREYISQEINKQFINIRNLEVSKLDFNCPEDAIDNYRTRLTNLIKIGIASGTILSVEVLGYKEIFPPPGSNSEPKNVPNSELDADRAQRQTYEQIRKKFNEWAQDQTWWQ